MEAAEGAPEPFVEFSVSLREPNNLLLVTIANACRELPVEEGEGRFATRKREKHRHGIGLQSVRRTLKKYGGQIEFYHTQSPQAFHALVSFPAPNK